MQVPVIDHSPVRRTRRLPVREREGDRTVMAADGPPALGRRNVESRALSPLELVPPPVEECAVCRSRQQEDATVAQYVHRFTFYPAAGQAGALGTVLRDWVRHRQARGMRLRLGNNLMSVDGPALVLEAEYVDLTALEEAHASHEADPVFGAFFDRLGGLLRGPVERELHAVLVPFANWPAQLDVPDQPERTRSRSRANYAWAAVSTSA